MKVGIIQSLHSCLLRIYYTSSKTRLTENVFSLTLRHNNVFEEMTSFFEMMYCTCSTTDSVC